MGVGTYMGMGTYSGHYCIHAIGNVYVVIKEGHHAARSPAYMLSTHPEYQIHVATTAVGGASAGSQIILKGKQFGELNP